MRYLLDTNICIYIAKQKPHGVLARLERLRSGNVGMSIITHLELVYGAWKSQHRDANLSAHPGVGTVDPGAAFGRECWRALWPDTRGTRKERVADCAYDL